MSQMSTSQPPQIKSRLGAILRATSGNFLEQFDFFLFGFYATYIAKTFFPAASEFASLMQTFAVFGAGFLMRPLGAIILGAYIDKVGRRRGLIVGRRGIGTRLGYERAGITGPWLLRIIFSALDRRSRYIPWDDVAEWDGRTVRTRRAAL